MKVLISTILIVSFLCSFTLGKQSQQFGQIIKLCDGFADRDSLINDEDEAEANRFRWTMQYLFPVSGNQLILRLIYTQNNVMDEFITILKQLKLELGLFIGPFLIGLFLAIIILPFLCCCCCCASNKNSRLLTKCQMWWPSTILILALLFVVGSSVIGLIRASDVQSSYKAVGCSLGIALNDSINGQISSKGKYFIGINGISKSLKNLKDKSGDVKDQMDKIQFSNTSSYLRNTYEEGISLMNAITQIPNGIVGEKMPNYTYNHFDGTPANIPSTFPSILGAQSNTSSQGAINASYYVFNQLNQGLKTVGTNADSYSSQFDTINTTIDSITSQLATLIQQIYDTDDQITKINQLVTPGINISTLSVQIFFGVFIGLGALAVLATVTMTCFHKYSCRYVLYFICIIFSLLAILCFLFSVIFSIVTPTLYFGCDFLTVSISSPADFNKNFQKLLGTDVSNTVQVCVPGGSGDIINQLSGIDLSSINGLTNAINQMRNYDVTQIQQASNASILALSELIDKYYYTYMFDFDSQSDKNIMNKIANPTNYQDCNINRFLEDSWVPSLNQTQISCYGTKSTASDVECPDSQSISTGRSNSTQPTGCFGCMDTTKVLLKSSNVRNDLQIRYDVTSNCVVWINQMDNLWNNYYKVKDVNINPVKQRMEGVKDKYFSENSGYYARMTVIGTEFSEIIQTLQSIVSSVFDANYGMIAGLNCLVLGEDISLIINTACAASFRIFFFLRIILGVSAFGILLAMCCISFSGMRAYKQSVGRKDYLDQEAMMRMPLLREG